MPFQSLYKILGLPLCILLLPGALYAKDKTDSAGIIPATPPVNVHTRDVETSYSGFGYLNFNVALTTTAKPAFTLNRDEDAEYELGEVEYRSHGIVYVDKGHLGNLEASEHAWIAGIIDGNLKDDYFYKFGARFNAKVERSGIFVGTRNTTAKRLGGTSGIAVDYAFTSMWAFYNLSGNTRFESVGGLETYRDDFDENSLGIVYRPMLTIQPRINIGDKFTFIPFAGITAFLNLDYSSWEVNDWYDQNYGRDCIDGCADDGFFTHIIPLESFLGFDLEYQMGPGESISLSAFFAVGSVSDTESMSELYIVYSKPLH